MLTPSDAPNGLRAIDRRSLREEAVDHIRTAILSGELQSGQRITELGLAKRLGVGQATIREALIELEHQGFIVRRAPRQSYVTVLTRADIDDIYLVRSQLEVLAVRQLLDKPPSDLSEAEAAYHLMLESAASGDLEKFCAADFSFHQALWKSCGSQSILQVLQLLVPKIFAFDRIHRAHPTREKRVEVALLHGRLLQMIRCGNPDAVSLMQASMQQALREDSELVDASGA